MDTGSVFTASAILSTDLATHQRCQNQKASFCSRLRRGADIFYQKDRQFQSLDDSRLWIPGGSPYTGVLSPESEWLLFILRTLA